MFLLGFVRSIDCRDSVVYIFVRNGQEMNLGMDGRGPHLFMIAVISVCVFFTNNNNNIQTAETMVYPEQMNNSYVTVYRVYKFSNSSFDNI